MFVSSRMTKFDQGFKVGLHSSPIGFRVNKYQKFQKRKCLNVGRSKQFYQAPQWRHTPWLDAVLPTDKRDRAPWFIKLVFGYGLISWRQTSQRRKTTGFLIPSKCFFLIKNVTQNRDPVKRNHWCKISTYKILFFSRSNKWKMDFTIQ